MIDRSCLKAAENNARSSERLAKQGRDRIAREQAERAFILLGAALGLDAGYVHSALGTRSPNPGHYAELLKQLNEDSLSIYEHERDTRERA